MSFLSFNFSCHICRTTACWNPEILLPWQRDVTASPLWWRITTKIWVVLLVCSNKFNQKHFPDLGSDASSCSTDFLRSFLGRHFTGRPVVASRGGGVLLVILGRGLPPGSMLTLFQTKKCHSSHPFSDLASIHTHSQTWPLRNYVIIT